MAAGRRRCELPLRAPPQGRHERLATLTQGLAWAPTSSIATEAGNGGSPGWTGNQSLGFSAWRAFKVDTVAPTVVSKTPTGKVARTTNFVAKFSEPMKHVDTTSFEIFVKGQQHNLSATVTMSNGNKTATLNPTANLQSGKVYTIKLTGQITDRGGNALPRPAGRPPPSRSPRRSGPTDRDRTRRSPRHVLRWRGFVDSCSDGRAVETRLSRPAQCTRQPTRIAWLTGIE